MSDDLRDGIACWLASEESLDWDKLDEDERGGYRDSATDLLRFVREPLSEAAAQPPNVADDPETWLVLRMGTHERLAEFSDYDEAIAFARKLHRGGAEVQVMTARNAPDPVAADHCDGGPPRGWCPECGGPSQCAPGTCPGVGAPEATRELHQALDDLQGLTHRLGFCCYAAALDPNAPCPWHTEGEGR